MPYDKYMARGTGGKTLAIATNRRNDSITAAQEIYASYLRHPELMDSKELKTAIEKLKEFRGEKKLEWKGPRPLAEAREEGVIEFIGAVREQLGQDAIQIEDVYREGGIFMDKREMTINGNLQALQIIDSYYQGNLDSSFIYYTGKY